MFAKESRGTSCKNGKMFSPVFALGPPGTLCPFMFCAITFSPKPHTAPRDNTTVNPPNYRKDASERPLNSERPGALETSKTRKIRSERPRGTYSSFKFENPGS